MLLCRRCNGQGRVTIKQLLQEKIEKACKDCTRYGFSYIVRDEVWALTGLGPKDGKLCLQCLELRIGRQVMLEDFPDHIPINQSLIYMFKRGFESGYLYVPEK